MKTIRFTKYLAVLSTALALALSATPAQAGPGTPQLYHPVTSIKQAQALPVGRSIAVSCGNCGGISVLKVDQERSYLHGYTCPLCKSHFRVTQPGGGGRTVAMGQFVYTDEAGHVSHLTALR